MKKILALLVLASSVYSYGQLNKEYKVSSNNSYSFKNIEHDGHIKCGTMEHDSIVRSNNPSMGTLSVNDDWLQNKVDEHKALYSNGSGQKLPILVIPVVVHVIHNGDAVGSGENIADGQVLSQIQVLNEDFRREVGTPGFNSHADGADVEIQFCMAQVDPSGNPTDGIDRVDLGQATWNST